MMLEFVVSVKTSETQGSKQKLFEGKKGLETVFLTNYIYFPI